MSRHRPAAQRGAADPSDTQQAGSSTGTAGSSSAASTLVSGMSVAGPAATACTRSSRPGHRALNGPKTSPETSTRIHPGSAAAGRRPAAVPLWHQSLRTVAAPGVHQRQPCPGAAVRATASETASVTWAIRGFGSLPACSAPSWLYPSPAAPTDLHAARSPADAATSASARAPVTMNACTTSISVSTTSGGHRMRNGSTSPRCPRDAGPRRPECRLLCLLKGGICSWVACTGVT